MTQLENFRAYTKSLELFDFVVADTNMLRNDPALSRLVGQQLASADSIAANIEEGYGRGSSKDYAHFLVIARGSAQETVGRYRRMTHWLPETAVAPRIALCNEIIAILTATITTLRNRR